jgi:hypothetical protein
MTNFVESEAAVGVLYDPALRAEVLHFSIKPASASVDYFEAKDQYFCAFSISVSLLDAARP